VWLVKWAVQAVKCGKITNPYSFNLIQVANSQVQSLKNKTQLGCSKILLETLIAHVLKSCCRKPTFVIPTRPSLLRVWTVWAQMSGDAATWSQGCLFHSWAMLRSGILRSSAELAGHPISWIPWQMLESKNGCTFALWKLCWILWRPMLHHPWDRT
jgi:hypothetical protein